MTAIDVSFNGLGAFFNFTVDFKHLPDTDVLKRVRTLVGNALI